MIGREISGWFTKSSAADAAPGGSDEERATLEAGGEPTGSDDEHGIQGPNST